MMANRLPKACATGAQRGKFAIPHSFGAGADRVPTSSALVTVFLPVAPCHLLRGEATVAEADASYQRDVARAAAANAKKEQKLTAEALTQAEGLRPPHKGNSNAPRAGLILLKTANRSSVIRRPLPRSWSVRSRRSNAVAPPARSQNRSSFLARVAIREVRLEFQRRIRQESSGLEFDLPSSSSGLSPHDWHIVASQILALVRVNISICSSSDWPG